jgi:hypothetical protein
MTQKSAMISRPPHTVPQFALPSGNSERNIWSSNYDVYGEGIEHLAQLLTAASGETTVNVRAMQQTDSDVTR